MALTAATQPQGEEVVDLVEITAPSVGGRPLVAEADRGRFEVVLPNGIVIRVGTGFDDDG